MNRPRLRLRLTGAAESAVRTGHPWVYSDKVREQNRPGRAGEVAVVYDRNDRFLALGLYDPDSPIALRVLHRGSPVLLEPAWWVGRLRDALSRRAPLATADTTGYRILNGESDGFPGLVVDRYADCLVVKAYTPAWLGSLGGSAPGTVSSPQLGGGLTRPPWPPIPGLTLVPLLIDALQPARIVLRLSRNVAQVAGQHGLMDGQNLHGTDASPSVVFREDGLGFESDVVRGQKTGFFLDQRGNRREVGRMAAGGRVLNVFSFSGGFSVHAARGGAVAVTDVDISPHALASARRNMALNAGHPSVARSRHDQVQADAFRWLEAAPRGAWDLVILDPPSMAKREPERSGAIEAYGRLARLGAACVAPGGRLLAASCSAHVTTDEFLAATRAALRGSGTAWTEERVAGHEADHPAEFPEAQYLKALQARRSS